MHKEQMSHLWKIIIFNFKNELNLPSPLLSALRIKSAYFIETTRIKLQIIRLTAPIHWNSLGGEFLLWNIVSRTYNGLVPLKEIYLLMKKINK